jgi:3D (Asp-Asp-Asp) domain-containing protein
MRGEALWLARSSFAAALIALVGVAPGCSTASSTWVAEPLGGAKEPGDPRAFQPPAPKASAPLHPRAARRIGGAPDVLEERKNAVERASPAAGRDMGVFRNTYYDFPQERDYGGEEVPLFGAACQKLASVPRGFHDTVCVQGSGLLANGRTVSFARRGCSCARHCPRTSQQICFEVLDEKHYPWGRGAMGQPVVPLLTVAVDSAVVPLGTSMFIPEYVGLPRDLSNRTSHDGCFIAQDRGVKVRGRHVDIFTGEEALTRLWNELVPSNRGVTVMLDSPLCAPAAY